MSTHRSMLFLFLVIVGCAGRVDNGDITLVSVVAPEARDASSDVPTDVTDAAIDAVDEPLSCGSWQGEECQVVNGVCRTVTGAPCGCDPSVPCDAAYGDAP